MKNKLTFSKTVLYLFLIYMVIFFQYPFGLAVGKFILNVNLFTQITPDYLLIWGLFRLFVVLPLVFYLTTYIQKPANSIYLQFGDKKRMLSFTFWGTLAFIILGILLYPQFLHTTKLSLDNFFYLFPFFSLFAISNAFVEETFFRGSGLAILTEKMPFWLANFLQAFFFGLIHIINPMSSNLWLFVILTFILGIFWGWLTQKTKSLIPAIVLHIIADVFVAISLF